MVTYLWQSFKSGGGPSHGCIIRHVHYTVHPSNAETHKNRFLGGHFPMYVCMYLGYTVQFVHNSSDYLQQHSHNTYERYIMHVCCVMSQAVCVKVLMSAPLSSRWRPLADAGSSQTPPVSTQPSGVHDAGRGLHGGSPQQDGLPWRGECGVVPPVAGTPPPALQLKWPSCSDRPSQQ